jgi:hypothetical protein
MPSNMAATEDSFELSKAEQIRLEKAIQTVSDRRNGDLPINQVSERANLSLEVVREAMSRAANAENRIEQRNESRWVVKND